MKAQTIFSCDLWRLNGCENCQFREISPHYFYFSFDKHFQNLGGVQNDVIKLLAYDFQTLLKHKALYLVKFFFYLGSQVDNWLIDDRWRIDR